MRIRSLLLVVVLAGIMLSGCTAPSNNYYYEYDRGDCLTNRFEYVDHTLDIDVQWRYDTIYLTWNRYEASDFKGYYLVKIESDSLACPYYYIGSEYETYVGNSSRTYYQDDEVESDKTYYYRLCVKQDDQEISCGSVKRVTIY